MELWRICCIGIVIAVITRLAITLIYEIEKQSNVSELIEVLVQLLIIVCIVVIFGMPIAKLLSILFDFTSGINILFASVFAIATYLIAFFMLGLYNVKYKFMQICYVLAFTLSVFAFTQQAVDYNRNVEEINQTILEQSETDKLLYFCDIPLNDLPKEKSEEYFNPENAKNMLTKISKSGVATYCYLSKQNTFVSGTVQKQHYKITYIESSQTPYVEINSYYKCTKLIDHGNETIKPNSETRWSEYYFYLPESIIQYVLNQS